MYENKFDSQIKIEMKLKRILFRFGVITELDINRMKKGGTMVETIEEKIESTIGLIDCATEELQVIKKHLEKPDVEKANELIRTFVKQIGDFEEINS